MKNSEAIIVSIVLAIIFLYKLGSTPDASASMSIVDSDVFEISENNVDLSSWRENFSIELLRRLGNEHPSRRTIDFIVGWTKAEDTSNNAYLRNNPLNTTQSHECEVGMINGDGVKAYSSYECGLEATLQTLSYSPYSGIVYSLQRNDPEGALEALVASPWASGHYSGGFSY